MVSRPAKSSAWPPFVALGVAAAEVGVLVGFVPLAVAGVLLFGGGCAGIATEAGLAERPWPPLASVGVVVGAGGALVWGLRASALAPDALLAAAAADPLAVRAAVVLGAAVVLVAAGLAGVAVDAVR